jgi:hypothetical protein
MKKSLILILVLILFNTTSGQNNAIPPPIVTGPVTGPGSIFSASIVDLSPFGYTEEEYFLEGKARRYDFKTTPGNAPPNDPVYPGSFWFSLDGIPDFVMPISQSYPYKTRMIVRRPVVPGKFNGTVVVEWLNASNMHDIDSDWWQLNGHLMRSGYAWVGITAQLWSIHSPIGLRKWNPARYSTLDVTADSTLIKDELCFDIFSQAVAALKEDQKVHPLGDLRPEIIIATGHSRSAFMLTRYYNFIQPSSGIIDGFMIRGAGGLLRTDIPAKVFKLNAETDLIELWQIPVRQPDSDHLITWEFAGTSHADQTFLDTYSVIRKRDFGAFTSFECEMPLCSVIPFYYGFSAALDHLNRWIREKIAPPSGIQLIVQQTQPAVILEQDTLGNVLGGIRLPQFAVPIAMNSGKNAGESVCMFYGTRKEFDQSTLKSLYPTHQAYLKKFHASVLENLRAGYIIKADTSEMMDDARKLSSLWK